MKNPPLWLGNTAGLPTQSISQLAEGFDRSLHNSNVAMLTFYSEMGTDKLANGADCIICKPYIYSQLEINK